MYHVYSKSLPCLRDRPPLLTGFCPLAWPQLIYEALAQLNNLLCLRRSKYTLSCKENMCLDRVFNCALFIRLHHRNGVLTLTHSYLCRNNEIISLPAKLLDGLSHDSLRFSTSIPLCAIKEVYAYIEGGFHACEGVI